MTFDLACDRLLTAEGAYTDGAGDPGGETKFGISKRAYPTVDIKALTRDVAKGIYQRDFWDRINGQRLADQKPAMMFQLFDFAINSGIDTAIRALQRAVGVADDGHWGPVSLLAEAQIEEPDLILRLNAERLDFMTRLTNWPVAGKGWARRIAQNLRYGAEDA